MKSTLADRQRGQLCTRLLSGTTIAFLGTGRSLSKIEYLASSGIGHFVLVRIPTKPAMHSNSKPAGHSDLKPATRCVVRMGQFHDVVEGWEGQETG
ncbi:hypothetical protein J4G43_049825 [Bradyrhizobium barranii subsp. barranii]|uniref:Uncharacterized protein n=1 Tax=Bradyrhizobium barranii subsp. barranii TaxID=2823807 RepID=A0A939M278_9BRAD|nr:hypothetical protein [Bradyrhizobium barranii]UEM12406.1 hypothetical protein J4G43_049825 [Bradyrhizobium barranii subsp. barranii]